MSETKREPDRRSFLEALAGSLAGFFREFNRELYGPPEQERRVAEVQKEVSELRAAAAEQDAELAAVHVRLDELEGQVKAIVEQVVRERQQVLETLSRLEQLAGQIQARVEALSASEKPEDRARAEGWKRALKRAGQLIWLVVGATGAALYDAFIEDRVFPELWQRLKALLDWVQRTAGPLEPSAAAADLAPQPQPVPTPETPRVPAEVRTPEPEELTPRPHRGPIQFDWVTIPAGEFLMGSDKAKDRPALDDEMPQHRVYLPTYRIARVPVTVAQFTQFVRATGHRTTVEVQDSAWAWTGSAWQEIKGTDWAHPRGPGSDVRYKQHHPVTCVSWYDALAFCKWAGVRLPSEAEWEKAARGTDGRIYPWGNRPLTAELCNFNMNVGDTTPVGRYEAGASPYGVLDMAGNVWERTSSLKKLYPYDGRDGREDPQADGMHVLRGGSFRDGALCVRCACRGRFLPYYRLDDIGFRVVSPGF